MKTSLPLSGFIVLSNGYSILLQSRLSAAQPVATQELEYNQQQAKVYEALLKPGEGNGKRSGSAIMDNESTRYKKKNRNMNSRKPTNWYVITGGPGSGKTTTVNLLRKRGYLTTIEHARHYLDTQLVGGRTAEEIRENQKEFQRGVLEMQLEQEASLAPDDVVFLDRAIPDTLAYNRFLKLPQDNRLGEALSTFSYKKIFILDLLPLVQDYARREDEAAQKRIHELLLEVYSSLHFPVIRVPVWPPEERVDFILKNL